jgi:hypothetical protein
MKRYLHHDQAFDTFKDAVVLMKASQGEEAPDHGFVHSKIEAANRRISCPYDETLSSSFEVASHDAAYFCMEASTRARRSREAFR